MPTQPDASVGMDCAFPPDADAAAPADAGSGPDAESLDTGPDTVLVGAGDISSCAHPAWSETTARLLDAFPDAIVFAAGDESNDEGTVDQYANCFHPGWGRHLGRMRAAMGNHDAKTDRGAPYYAFFGASAGPAGKGYYSFEAGSWHVIVLNSNCDKAGGCSATSPQGRWLAADLAAHPTRCTLAIWHHPLFSSVYGGTSGVGDFWTLLHAAKAELVINGHDHVYERYAPQDPEGNADPAQGLRQIIVGTGGAGNSPFPSSSFQPNSEAHSALALGVIKLTLRSDSYRWEFVPEPGKSFSDSGEGQCH